MQSLIEDLLIYSRVGTRARPLEMTDAKAAVDEALGNLAARIEQSGRRFTWTTCHS